MTLEELTRMGMAAKFDPDDIERVYVGSLEERKKALMRLVVGTYSKGWDECELAFVEGLALAGIAFTLPAARA